MAMYSLLTKSLKNKVFIFSHTILLTVYHGPIGIYKLKIFTIFNYGSKCFHSLLNRNTVL
jgi:hypothetical protein